MQAACFNSDAVFIYQFGGSRVLLTIIKLFGGEHYLAVLLVLILSCILLGRHVLSDRVNQHSMWITILACILLVLQDVLAKFAEQDPSRQLLGIAASIAGYSLRPAAVLGFLLVVWSPKRKRWFLWLPVLLNCLLYCTAFFSPLTFSYNGNYVFQRGPLNWVMFAVCIAYMILILITIHVRFRDRRAGDTFVLYLCALGCLGSVAVDFVYEEFTVVSAILISSMTFYLFLRAQDADHDPLTRLWNRMTFYEDCKKHRNAVTAVAAIDMNGLKKINDELGHDAGDRALKMIGRALRGVMSKKAFAYRVGGDEFILLLFYHTEEEIHQVLQSFLEEVWRMGQSVSVGLATRAEALNSLDEMIRLSDQRMYDEKSRYYQQHDRRRSRQSSSV